MSSTSSSPTALSPGHEPLYLPENIVVLVHGNNGAPSDFECVNQTLRHKYSTDELLVINSAVNHTQTSLGVDVGGEKLAGEIVNAILKYDLNPQINVYKLSIIAHSLGGLYARYAIAQVQEELSMLNMDYVSFVTLCTPHLGSRRPRAESKFKNFYRMGVHTVLASKSIYGQTGVDLLVANDTKDPDADPNKKPLLEVMSEHDSVFVRALRKFRHCTLVAMADGDVVVPFASASIRSYNPYESILLSKSFTSWRWHLRHTGFHKAPANLLERLNENMDELMEVEREHEGLDCTQCERCASVEGEYDCDNKREVEFKFELIQRMQAAVPWRRVDILVEPSGVKGKLRLHDWPINKMQQPDCKSLEFIELLADIVGSDHGLELRRLTEPITVPSVSSSDVDVDIDGSEERPSRLSFTKWTPDKKQIGDQIGSFFQSVKSRFTPPASTATSADSDSDSSSSEANGHVASVVSTTTEKEATIQMDETAPRPVYQKTVSFRSDVSTASETVILEGVTTEIGEAPRETTKL